MFGEKHSCMRLMPLRNFMIALASASFRSGAVRVPLQCVGPSRATSSCRAHPWATRVSLRWRRTCTPLSLLTDRFGSSAPRRGGGLAFGHPWSGSPSFRCCIFSDKRAVAAGECPDSFRIAVIGRNGIVGAAHSNTESSEAYRSSPPPSVVSTSQPCGAKDKPALEPIWLARNIWLGRDHAQAMPTDETMMPMDHCTTSCGSTGRQVGDINLDQTSCQHLETA